MPSRGGPIPDSIQKLKQQLDQFRSARKGRARFPEALWQAAVEQARQHGVNLVAHTLGLDYGGLRRRLGGVRTPLLPVVPPSGQAAAPAFVELVSATGGRAEEYVIEFEFGASPRLRVQWNGVTPPDWAALLRAWRDVAG